MICARCKRQIKGASEWYLGKPFGPVCAQILALTTSSGQKSRAKRDSETLDLFGDQNGKQNEILDNTVRIKLRNH